jgi:hypothetical protein
VQHTRRRLHRHVVIVMATLVVYVYVYKLVVKVVWVTPACLTMSRLEQAATAAHDDFLRCVSSFDEIASVACDSPVVADPAMPSDEEVHEHVEDNVSAITEDYEEQERLHGDNVSELTDDYDEEDRMADVRRHRPDGELLAVHLRVPPPPPPTRGGPTTWRSQRYREGVNGGKARFANRGGKNKKYENAFWTGVRAVSGMTDVDFRKVRGKKSGRGKGGGTGKGTCVKGGRGKSDGHVQGGRPSSSSR